MRTPQANSVNVNRDFLEVCEKSARAGAKALMAWQGRFKVREKGPADLVTEADLASQEAVRATILGVFPEHDFLAEEDAGPVARKSDYQWIVDPLDGTTNYVHGVPQYAVSVALVHAENVLVGTVYDPSTEECFTAARGEGAWLNGERIAASTTTDIGQALLAVSFPARVEIGSRPMVDFENVVVRCRAIRRSGSAALNLCYVACGRYDAYFARETKAWDVAAGVLLISEAGGTITALDGQPFSLERPTFIAAGSAGLHATLFDLVGDRG
ncbi:MAG TPA: inositol monophosphatase family protein [Pirellulales bacterium]|nr:inositol monophosphatase family protein [Pirellulales bacterium]